MRNYFEKNMIGTRDKEVIVRFIQNYFKKYNKSPSMKIISKECKKNPREIYELFKNQKEIFKIAGIPYSDEKRKNVESANVARRKQQDIKILSEKKIIFNMYPPIYRAQLEENRNLIDRFDELHYNLANNKNKLLQLNPQDETDIAIAYQGATLFVNVLNMKEIDLKEKYKECLSIKSAPIDIEKIFLVNQGFDFDNLEESFRKQKEKIFNQELELYNPPSQKARYYYKKILNIKE